MRFALGLAVCCLNVAIASAQEVPAKAKAKVELRWLETKQVQGLTESKGIQASCDPKNLVYLHKKPALVLTAAEISKTQLTKHQVGGGEHYLVALHLTKEARDKLAATTSGKQTKLLTVLIDGKNWCVFRYEKDKDKPFVPAVARAETFQPSVGFFSSEAEAQRLVDAFK